MIKKFITIIFILFCYQSNTLANDKYVGNGVLYIPPEIIKMFHEQYLNAPAGQTAGSFWIGIEKNGDLPEAIWLRYTFCPQGACRVEIKNKTKKDCERTGRKAYKEYPEIRDIECFLFAERYKIKWNNEKYLEKNLYKVQGSMSLNQLEERFAVLGFTDDSILSIEPTKSQTENSNNDDDMKLTGSTVEQLKQLNDLYKSGVLTKEEFTKAKNKILNN